MALWYNNINRYKGGFFMTTNNKFGMFIHWGIYAMTELQDQAVIRYDMDALEYEKNAVNFNPVDYDPEKWVLTAKKQV